MYMQAKTVKKFIINLFLLSTESSATYYRSLTDAKTGRTLCKTNEHKAACRRQARKRDVSFKLSQQGHSCSLKIVIHILVS